MLRDGRFLRLLASRAVSVYGNGLGPVALAFGVLGLPHATPTKLSVVEAANVLPMLLFLLVGGVIADRRSRLRLLVVAEAVGAVAWAGLAVLIGLQHAPIGALVALAFLGGCGTALLAPTMSGIVPELVAPDRLQSGNAYLRMTVNGGRVVGLASAGVLVAYAGAGWALGVDAMTFVASGVLLFSIGPGEPVPAPTTAVLADLRAGAHEFFSRQWLWVVVAIASLIVAVTEASVGVLGPIVAKQHYGGARAWSLVAVAAAVGTVAGATLAVRVRARRPLLVGTVVGFGLALPMLALGLPVPLAVPVAAAFIGGVCGDVFGVLWDTTMQREIPPRMLSRVSAYDWLGSTALAPIGLVVAGPVASAVGARPAELGCAGVSALACALALLSPQVRRLRAPDPARKHPAPAGVAVPKEA